MFVPARLAHYLATHQIPLATKDHAHSRSSAETARAARVPAHQLAKAVIVENDDGRCTIAVLPADRHVHLGRLGRLLDLGPLHLADESRLVELLPDCETGAVPAFGTAWCLDTVIDDELDLAGDTLYVECGDHEHLLCLQRDQFRELTQDMPRGHFSAERLH
jgi:Ala-tRNA(Pro) deacylase